MIVSSPKMAKIPMDGIIWCMNNYLFEGITESDITGQTMGKLQNKIFLFINIF